MTKKAFTHFKRSLLEVISLAIVLTFPFIIKALLDTAYDLKDLKLSLTLFTLALACFTLRYVVSVYSRELTKILSVEKAEKPKGLAFQKIIFFVFTLVGTASFATRYLQDTIGFLAAITIFIVITVQYAQEAIKATMLLEDNNATVTFDFPFIMMKPKKKEKVVEQGVAK